MAVKKRKTIRRQKEVFNRESLENLIVKLDPTSCIFKEIECFAYCKQIVDFLASLKVQYDEEYLKTIELAKNCFVLLMASLSNADVEDLILDILTKLYIMILEDKGENVSSSVTSIFVMLNFCEFDFVRASASRLLEKMDHGSKYYHCKVLTTFYYWVIATNTLEFGKWLLAFIHALEEFDYIDILVESSIECLEPLFFALMDSPIVTDVTLHLLTSMRHMELAFEKIAMVVPFVLSELAYVDRQLLQKIADLVSSMVFYQMRNFNVSDQEAYKERYEEVFKCLAKHMAFPKSPRPNESPTPKWVITEKDFRPISPVERKVGLYNQGNTCFLNSVIQALFYTREFSNQVMLKQFTGNCFHWSMLSSTFGDMLLTKKDSISPDDLEQPQVNTVETTNHNMAAASTSKTLRANAMISTNSTGEERPTSAHSNIAAVSSSKEPSPSKRQLEAPNAVAAKKPRLMETNLIDPMSILDECFAGTQVTRVVCLTCHIGSRTEDKFRDLSLSFPQKTDDLSYTVQELLDFYCSGEILYGDNLYYCGVCQERQIARRSVTVNIAPRHLILVLKNFEYDLKEGTQKKLFHSTYYNNILVLPTLGGRKITYTLYAAVVHKGHTMNSGHYYAIAEEFGQWYRLDDDNVNLVKTGELNKTTGTNTPYMLFYKREDSDVTQLPSPADLPLALGDSLRSDN